MWPATPGPAAPSRHTLTRELHDRIGPDIALVCRRLELYSLYRDVDHIRADEQLRSVQASLGHTLDDIRRLIGESRPADRIRDLPEALDEYVRTVECGGTDARLKFEGDAELIPLPVRGELYLMVREALRNALRHAAAECVEASVTVAPPLVCASIADDGRGLGAGHQTGGTGVGIAFIRERCRRLGGDVSIVSAPGAGTRVEIRLPLHTGPRHG